MRDYKTTTDHAAEIRASAKKLGWTSRDVSIRTEYYSMGSSIHITIKNIAVPKSQMQALADEHERIDRDQWGEILQGGNRFVSVNYSHQASEQMLSEYLPRVEAAIAALGQSVDCHQPIEGCPEMSVSRDNAGRLHLWTDRHLLCAWDAHSLALQAAVTDHS